MEWPDNLTLMLIDEYKKRECLWNRFSPFFKCASFKNKAWLEISDVLQCDIAEAKKKMNSLLASFRRERLKDGKRKIVQGEKVNEIYHSTWFAFKSFDFLLELSRIRGIKRQNHEEISTSEETSTGFPWPDIQNTIITEDDPISIMNISVKDECSNDQFVDIVSDEVDSVHHNETPLLKKIKISEIKSSEFKSDRTETNSESKTHNQLFAEYVAAKLDKYSEYEQNIVQNRISNILFQADMGHYKPKRSSFDET